MNRPGLGFSVEDVVGRTLFDILPPNAVKTISETVDTVFEQAQMVELDVPVITKDGLSQNWYACRHIPTVQDGQVVSATVIATDITQRKQDEDKLRHTQEELEQRIADRTSELAHANFELHSEIVERKQTEEQLSRRVEFERIVSSISSRFIDLEPEQIDDAVNESLRIVGEFAGSEHCCVSQLSGEPKLISMTHEWFAENVEPGMELLQDYPVETLPWFWQQIQRRETIRVPRVDKLPPEASALRARLQSRNNKSFIAVPLSSGHSLWGYLALSVENHHVEWTDDAIALMKIFGEISISTLERKRAGEALQLSEFRFRRLFQGNIIGSIHADIYGNIYDCNDTFLELLGYSREDPPRRWDELTPPEWREHDRRALKELQDNGVAAAPREKEYYHKDGHRVPVLLGVAFADDNAVERIAFVIDLTERKQAEERIREMTVKLEGTSRVSVMGEMTAGLAHELHQPLAVITNYANGCVRMLGKEAFDRNRLINSLKEIGDQAMRAGEILRRIRDFLHQREPQREYIDINHVIQDAIHLAKIDSRQPDVQTLADLGENLPAVYADSVQLTQTVLNLLLNGIEATAEHRNGQELVTIQSRVNNGDSHVQVSVTDSGGGVPSELTENVFEQFFTTKEDGLGMGLAICKSTIESHGGELWVKPHSNGGAEFCFTVPINEERSNEHRAVPSHAAES